MPTATEATNPISSSLSPVASEQQLGSIVFSHLLDEHPRRLTVDQLAHELQATEERAALERAVANLTDACLLHSLGDALILSPAAVRVDRGR